MRAFLIGNNGACRGLAHLERAARRTRGCIDAIFLVVNVLERIGQDCLIGLFLDWVVDVGDVLIVVVHARKKVGTFEAVGE